MKKFFLLFPFLVLCTVSAFAAGECSNDPFYQEKCNTPKIVPSYQCVLDNRYFFDPKSACFQKAENLFSQCSIAQLSLCDTPENDESNKFELCLAKNSDSCGEVGKQYS
jgi:hypothetical protein